MGLLITSDVLKDLNMTSQELLTEIAVHFYDKGYRILSETLVFAMGANQNSAPARPEANPNPQSATPSSKHKQRT